MKFRPLFVSIATFICICVASPILAGEPLSIYVGFHKNLGVLTLREVNKNEVWVKIEGDFGESPGGLCGGELSAIGTWRKDKIYVNEPPRDPDFSEPCKIEITLKEKQALVVEISGCAPYHGACASFDGQARKIYPQ